MTKEQLDKGFELSQDIMYMTGILEDPDFETLNSLDDIMWHFEDIKKEVYTLVRKRINEKLIETQKEFDNL